jgi:hypothetical protein
VDTVVAEWLEGGMDSPNRMRKGLNLRPEESFPGKLPSFAEKGFGIQLFFKMLEHRRIDSLAKAETPLDRLHLAAMEWLGLARLLTHDHRQAEAARALGFKIVAR